MSFTFFWKLNIVILMVILLIGISPKDTPIVLYKSHKLVFNIDLFTANTED